jgi:hypothetical protein
MATKRKRRRAPWDKNKIVGQKHRSESAFR